ncbi:hypothetical protein C2S53_000196 [Perilla frutescens var. hirtella]|uniref:Uncharacterized protein n=1 Tax=Perilla frutescens var. hirtella TaxID=608512 RepID=A0AAD4JAN0_PERFH|nr:hypothetical protein C2S53_000196 [Perilla frutescens var. hirtella]
MTLIDKLIFLVVHFLDKSGIAWHRLPVILGLIYLVLRRHLHEQYNLFNVGQKPAVGPTFDPAAVPFRTADGEFNDPDDKATGSSGSFFGRNVLPHKQNNKIELRAAEEVASQCPLKSFRFYKSKEIQIDNGDNGIKTGFLNRRTPWW